MYLCNAGVGISSNGKVHVNFTDCSKRTPHDVTNKTTSLTLKDDASGAMQYTVTVVFVYSIAVLGVFGLGLYNRRKSRRYRVDNETRAFLKNYEDVRRICEQKSRVGAIQSLLHQLHNEPLSNCDFGKISSSANSLAFLPISLSTLTEQEILNNILFDGANGLTELNGNKSENDLNQEQKGGSSPVRAKMTVLGSSRRSYKGCERCWSRRGIVTSDSCLCRFYERFETDENAHVTEIVNFSSRKQNSEETQFLRNSKNGESDHSCVSFV